MPNLSARDRDESRPPQGPRDQSGPGYGPRQSSQGPHTPRHQQPQGQPGFEQHRYGPPQNRPHGQPSGPQQHGSPQHGAPQHGPHQHGVNRPGPNQHSPNQHGPHRPGSPQHSHQQQGPLGFTPQDQEDSSRGFPWGLAAGWAAGVVVVLIAAVVAIWQVNERVYTAEATAEQYWESVQSGDGPAALSMVESTPGFIHGDDAADLDHVLLTGEPLATSAELIEGATLQETGEGAELEFIVGSENYTTEIPVTRTGSTWGFFDDWQITSSALTWFEVTVPGAPQGGIGQVTVNGEPVNLDEETTRLSAFVPTVADIDVDSQWLVGSHQHVVTAAENSDDPAERITLDLEASEEAAELLHTEVQEYFDACAEQQVLMPSGCPVGITTNHQVDADTITWDFPDPEEITLGFDAEGWHVDYENLTAQVSFDAVHYHTGDELEETEEVPFDLDIAVGADGEDLIVSVTEG